MVIINFHRGPHQEITERVQVPTGAIISVDLVSEYLVSAGQVSRLNVSATEVDAPRTLADILRDAADHGRDNPTHGTNCACMDKYIREIRLVVAAVLSTVDGPEELEWRGENKGVPKPSRKLDARWRISYVLGAVVRNL
jgi:hypothetical protein